MSLLPIFLSKDISFSKLTLEHWFMDLYTVRRDKVSIPFNFKIKLWSKPRQGEFHDDIQRFLIQYICNYIKGNKFYIVI